MNYSEKVIIGVSGGIDSAVIAYLLKKQGFQLKLVFLELFQNNQNQENKEEFIKIAQHLDCKWEIVNLEENFHSTIIENFLDEYSNARTPNPCIRCNSQIKFNALYKIMQRDQARWIATGHYARKFIEKDNITLMPAQDKKKDQTYYLHQVPREILLVSLFPLGDYTKEEVKNIYYREFPWNSKKKESQDICFLSDGDYRSFYKKHRKVQSGYFKNIDGQILGPHLGKEMYTIGQRRGLNIALGYPLYVAKIKRNGDVILGKKDILKHQKFIIKEVNLLNIQKFSTKDKYRILVQIRYQSFMNPAFMKILPNGTILVELDKSISGVTPGQSGVIFDINDQSLIGGGIIHLL